MLKNSSEERAVEVPPGLVPFVLPLPQAISLPFPVKPNQNRNHPYSLGIYNFKQFLDKLTTDDEGSRLPAPQLGRLAIGLVKGTFSSWSRPFPSTGAPSQTEAKPHIHSHVIENNAVVGIRFDDPKTMYRDWALTEKTGIGPSLQGAIRLVIANRANFETILGEMGVTRPTS
jgi:hypothetical protein